MAFRPLLRQRAVVPAMAAAVSAGAVLAPRRVDAEETPAELSNRKPIYDEMALDTTAPTLPSSTKPAGTRAEPYRPTPTDRLAVQIGHARMALYHQAVRGERAVDNALTQTLRLEHSFTSTMRSLAPPRESGEKIFPGALYVLVASMAGSMVTRNRNLLLRASVPLAVGITAAHLFLPTTSKNVGDLIWTYEEKYPVLADAHLRTRTSITELIETGKAHAGMGLGMVEGKLHATKDGLEDWVRKGR
ncbi:apolipo protein O-domain-containing protein [Ampelomyces quisqualis]|uniref:MICOS complex subunit n=1 Tax=Ampelomyces quisqualis TaxID=50730 RepID=A0A6A5QXY7_AMPQU|nr:apolipo protein O-domain-containing protein [Ampelomyces quisqualis]